MLPSLSSSSAIFERDIEPIVCPSPPNAHYHQPNPHRIPRAKGTEHLEQSVPSVLDSAAAILTHMGNEDVTNEVAVVSPAGSILEVVERSSGFASPIGSLRSRSPSPVGSRVGQVTSAKGEILLTIPVSAQAPQVISFPTSILGLHNIGTPSLSPPPSTTISPQRPTIHTSPSVANTSDSSGGIKNIGGDVSILTPTVMTPSSVYFSASDSVMSSRQPSPKTTTLEHPPNVNCSTNLSPPSQMTSPSVSSQPPSPIHHPKKRLSFMSYSDILASTPSTTLPLSSLTTCASSADPPPHIPSVSGLNVVNAVSGSTNGASRAPSLRGFPLGTISIGPIGGLTHPGKRDGIALLDNLGGEWEREGLGKGLEERLDALVLTG